MPKSGKELQYQTKTPTPTSSQLSKQFKKGEKSQSLKQEIKEKNWYIFTLSFASLAKIGCDDFLKTKNIDGEKQILIVSILFNFKHAIEVVIKEFNRLVNPDFDKSDKGHDVKILFKKLKDCKRIRDKINKSKKLKKYFTDLENMIVKYYELAIFQAILTKAIIMDDYENFFLKYPENETKISVNYGILIGKTTKVDIKDIKKDIETFLYLIKNIKDLIKK